MSPKRSRDSSEGLYTIDYKYFLFTAVLFSVSHCVVKMYSLQAEVTLANKPVQLQLWSASTRHNYPPSKTHIDNIRFCSTLVKHMLWLNVIIMTTLTSVLILMAGDIHPNPGPIATDISSSSSSSTLSNLLSSSHCLSIVHYNIQSLLPKIDIIASELSAFDILTFSETWLSDSTKDEQLVIKGFSKIIRRDRVSDGYGGVAAYISDSLNFARRPELELFGTECIWLEIFTSKTKSILLGIFYRPPSSNQVYTQKIEDCIGLALDSGGKDVVVTGDFNWNVSSETSLRKVTSLCLQFGLHQCIDEPTHYTENSNSILDLLFVSDINSVVFSGVGVPFWTKIRDITVLSFV